MSNNTVSSTVTREGGAFVISATILDTPGTIAFTDFYNPAVKTYSRQGLALDIPDSVSANYTRSLTGATLAPPVTSISLIIRGPGGDARAQMGDTITLSGTVTPAPPEGTTVILNQPEFGASWTATT